jgi:hypothetical protein
MVGWIGFNIVRLSDHAVREWSLYISQFMGVGYGV